MTVTIVLPPKLESSLRKRAARAGIDTSAYVIKALESDLARENESGPKRLSAADTQLLQDVSAGLDPEFWQRYRQLKTKRRTRKLTSQEQAEIMHLSDEIEEANARRLAVVVKYAKAKRKPLADVMKQFNIGELGNV